MNITKISANPSVSFKASPASKTDNKEAKKIDYKKAAVYVGAGAAILATTIAVIHKIKSGKTADVAETVEEAKETVQEVAQKAAKHYTPAAGQNALNVANREQNIQKLMDEVAQRQSQDGVAFKRADIARAWGVKLDDVQLAQPKVNAAATIKNFNVEPQDVEEIAQKSSHVARINQKYASVDETIKAYANLFDEDIKNIQHVQQKSSIVEDPKVMQAKVVDTFKAILNQAQENQTKLTEVISEAATR